MHVMESDRNLRKSRGSSTWIMGCLFLSIFLTNACTMTDQVVRQETTHRVLAENSQMKKRLPLIERENDVLKQENLQYKIKAQQLATSLKKLNVDLATLREAYASDFALYEEQLRNLEEEYCLLENESTRKITELTALYLDSEVQRNQELKKFDEQMAMQMNAFREKNDMLMQEFSSKESELSSALNEAKKDLEEKKLEITALKSAYNEISIQLKEVSAQLAKRLLERDQAENAFPSEKAAYELMLKLESISGQIIMNNPPTVKN